MRRPIFISLLLIVFSICVRAQYTETINTYRPGTSQGAFGVGKNVIQFETGMAFGTQKHDVFNNKTNITEFLYNIRVGLFKEQLEFGLQGNYLSLNSNDRVGSTSGIKRNGFPFNVLGVKYLFYDPYKYEKEQTENIISWKANQRFSFKKLIPAVSAYVGANFSSTTSKIAPQNNPDTRITEVPSNITPVIVIAAQNVWSEKLVFTINLASKNLTTDFHELSFIGTTTYNFNEYFSFFGEYEGISSVIYKDHLLKIGGAYLLNPNLQFDARILGNVKNTPSIFNFALGASFRLDYHKISDNEYIDTGEDHAAKKVVEQIKKDIEAGLLSEDVLKGQLQSVSEDGVIVERYKGIDLEEFVQEEEEEEEFDEEFDEEIDEEEDTRIKWWQIGKRRRLRKKALADTTSTKRVVGSGGRSGDFLDEEFIKNKQAEITPAERTPEELAELELRREEERGRKKKRKIFGKGDKANQVYIDKVTGDTIAPPDYSGMSKKERKIAKKQHRELFSLDDEDLDGLFNEVEEQQSIINAEKERKRKEKEARKAARKSKKNRNKADLNEDYDEDWGEEEKPLQEPPKSNSETTKEEDPFKDIEFEEDKELKRIEAELAKEEEKERKRKEKEAARKAKEDAALQKANDKQATQEAKRLEKQRIEQQRLEEQKEEELLQKQQAIEEAKQQKLANEKEKQAAAARKKKLEEERRTQLLLEKKAADAEKERIKREQKAVLESQKQRSAEAARKQKLEKEAAAARKVELARKAKEAANLQKKEAEEQRAKAAELLKKQKEKEAKEKAKREKAIKEAEQKAKAAAAKKKEEAKKKVVKKPKKKKSKWDNTNDVDDEDEEEF